MNFNLCVCVSIHLEGWDLVNEFPRAESQVTAPSWPKKRRAFPLQFLGQLISKHKNP